MQLRASVLIVIMSCCGLWPLAPVLAQDTASPPAESDVDDSGEPGNSDAVFSDEIVVTARKRAEDLQDVPVAVTPISGELLEETGAGDISELQARVPSLSIYPSRSQSTTATVFIRGVGQIDTAWGADPGVGIYLDDVYYARPQMALLDIFDVERVEVLRGPQGTLYGKNAVGGTIKYISRPLTDDFSGMVGVTVGDHGTQEFKALVSGSLVPGKLRAKASIASLQRDGYGTNLLTGEDTSDKDTLAGRLALDWIVSDKLNVAFRFDRTEDRSASQGKRRLEANFFCPFFAITCEPLPGPFDSEDGIPPINESNAEGYALIVDWSINEHWRFKSISGYRESDRVSNFDLDTSPAPIIDTFSTFSEEQTTQEFRFLYDGDRFSGVFGLYYLDGTAGGIVDNTQFGFLFLSVRGFTDTESIAVFGDGSYAISDRLTFNFGLRATEEEKRGVSGNALFTDGTYTTIAARLADYDESDTFSSVSPKLGLEYAVNDNVMAYVSASQGFRSGGFNIRASSAVDPENVAQRFDDETLTVYEVGVKSLLADNSLRLNTALFYGDYDDIQVSTFTSFDSDGDGVDDLIAATFKNAGEATLQGLEVEYDWRPRSADWFGVSGNLAFLDGSPDGFLDENDDGFVDAQVLNNDPDFAGLIELNFDFPAFGGLFNGSVGYSYREDSVLTNEGGPDPLNPTQPLQPLVQPGFGLINARAGWTSRDSHWQFVVHGKNLADEDYISTGYNLPAAGIVLGLQGPPRTVGATLNYRF